MWTAVVYKNKGRPENSLAKSSSGFSFTNREHSGGSEDHQTRAADHVLRWVTIGALALFSIDTGDVLLLASEDHLAARLARNGNPEEIYFEETDSRFAIGWKGNYRIDRDAFLYPDKDSGHVVTIFGYPVRRIEDWS